MKNHTHSFCMAIIVTAICFFSWTFTYAEWGDLLKQGEKTFGYSGSSQGGLSQDKIGKGLKEALKIGSENAVKKVSVINGYYGNPEIRIPLPGPVQKVEKALKAVGYGPKVDAFAESMNRAAEKAAPLATNLFWDALKAMTFDDAKKILQGSDNAATLYLKDKTGARLLEIFKPMVHDAMGKVGVTKQYQDLEAKARNLPLVGTNLGIDMDQYVSEKALDGLFLMLGKEEQKIRKDPAARVTDLLKDVFGAKK